MIRELREGRQWLGEVRRWLALLRPVAKRTIERGRREAQPKAVDEPAIDVQVQQMLRGMGFKVRPVQIAVAHAVIEVGREDQEGE